METKLDFLQIFSLFSPRECQSKLCPHCKYAQFLRFRTFFPSVHALEYEHMRTLNRNKLHSHLQIRKLIFKLLFALMTKQKLVGKKRQEMMCCTALGFPCAAWAISWCRSLCYFISIQNPAHDLGWKGFLVVISSSCLLQVFTAPFLVRDYSCAQ